MLSDGDQLTIGANGFCQIKLSMTTDITSPKLRSHSCCSNEDSSAAAAAPSIPVTAPAYDDLFDDTDEFNLSNVRQLVVEMPLTPAKS